MSTRRHFIPLDMCVKVCHDYHMNSGVMAKNTWDVCAECEEISSRCFLICRVRENDGQHENASGHRYRRREGIKTGHTKLPHCEVAEVIMGEGGSVFHKLISLYITGYIRN